jgi:hypothetical protein
MEYMLLTILYMPQMQGIFWISLISWMFGIFSFTIWYHTAISFPSIIKTQLSRI